MRVTTTGPLSETLRRVSALDAHLDYRIGLPDERGWHRLGDLVDQAVLVAWHDELAAREGDGRTAAAYMGGWLAAAVVDAYLLPVLAEARLPLADLDGVGVHRHADGWFDAVALPDRPFAVLPDDAAAPTAAADGAVVLADRAALLDATALRLAGVAPLFDSMRAVLPAGLAALSSRRRRRPAG